VHGTGGSLSVPDPNRFAGPVELFPAGPGHQWSDVGVLAGYVGAGRGYGVADLAVAARDGRPHRAADETALHVLDIMESLQAASDARTSVALTTTCRRPAAVENLVDLTS
jgi:predicted dehydrogenase